MNPNQEKNLSIDQNNLVRISPRGSVASHPTEANSILGKRKFSICEDALTKLSSNFDKESAQNDESNESEDKKHKRLMQNRKSAKKCRQKKKYEFVTMQQDVVNLESENKVLKEKVNDITMMLYNKIEENAHIQRKLDQALLQNQMVMTQILANNSGNGNNANSTASSLFSSPQLNQQDSVGSMQANLYGMPATVPMMQQQQSVPANNVSQSAGVLNLLQAVMQQQKQQQMVVPATEQPKQQLSVQLNDTSSLPVSSSNGALTTGAQNLIKKLLAAKTSNSGNGMSAANASSSSGSSSPLSSSMKNAISKQ